MTVTLQRLRYFVAVAEDLNFTRAAARLHVSQPSLSEQIRRLEAGLGVMLFDRTTRAVTLTDAGRAYLEDVREALAVLERAGERARATRPAVAVRIAYTASTAYKVLPLLVDALAATRAGVDVVALPRPAAAACEDLVRGDADLALIRDFTGAPRLVGEVVRREPVAVFMAADHPLAARAALRLDDLRGRTIAVVSSSLSPGLHDLPGALCATRGFSPALEEFPGLADRELLFSHLARRPDLVFLGPASIATVAWAGVVAVPVADPAATSAVSAVWRDDGPSAAAGMALSAARTVGDDDGSPRDEAAGDP